MKKIIVLGAFAALLPVAAFAAYVGVGDSVSSPLPAADKEIGENVYLVGGTVNVSNPVLGDLSTAGGTVVVSGKVDRDILAAGGNVSIIGGEAEDIRVAGGNLTIGGKVNGEIMAAGGQVSVTSDAVIARDSYIAGGTLSFAGTENGNLTLAGGEVRVDGIVNGNLLIKNAQKVTFGPRAVVKGTVEYFAPKEATIEDGAQLSSAAVFHKIEDSRGKGSGVKPFMAIFGIMFLLKQIAVLAAAYLLWYLRKHDMTSAIEGVFHHFWKTLFRGFAVLVLIPIAAIILLFTVIGWVPAAVLIAAYIALLALAVPTAAIIATSLLMALFKKGRTSLEWYHILGGVIVLSILGFIPVVGWIACFVVFLVSLGAVAGILKTKFSV